MLDVEISVNVQRADVLRPLILYPCSVVSVLLYFGDLPISCPVPIENVPKMWPSPPSLYYESLKQIAPLNFHRFPVSFCPDDAAAVIRY